jgi:hypothetical protein
MDGRNRKGTHRGGPGHVTPDACAALDAEAFGLFDASDLFYHERREPDVEPGLSPGRQLCRRESAHACFAIEVEGGPSASIQAESEKLSA